MTAGHAGQITTVVLALILVGYPLSYRLLLAWHDRRWGRGMGRGGETWAWDNPGWNLLPSDGELAASEERLDRSLRTIAHEENPAERSNAQTGPVKQTGR